MRQFVLGLLVAAFVWWGYGSFVGKPAVAGTSSPGVPEVPAADPQASPNAGLGGGLESVLAKAPQVPVPSTSETARTSETALSSAAVTAASVKDVLEGVAAGDLNATDRAWSMLVGQVGGADRSRLIAALIPAAADFATMLAQLGTYNTFLHSAEGRAQAGKVLAVAMSLPDAEAVTAGTQLINLCLRGHLRREDSAERSFVDEAYHQHRVRVDRWLCDPANVQSSRSYTVQKGDSLARIASKFRREKIYVEDGTLSILNRIHNPNAIQVGQKVKVPVDPIVTVLEKRSFSLCVYVGDRLLRLYWVGHGENDKTPLAEFTILEKQEKPDWTAPDGNVYAYGRPENILGEYFVKLQHESYTGFGLHGTPMPETICTMSSAGCIRMLAPDIAEVFKLLPRGTKVIVRATAPAY
jgi:LysM repeat protein